MTIDNERAEHLLRLPKKIVTDGKLCEQIAIFQRFPFCKRYELVSEQDDEFTFLWEFQQSKKNTIRVSVHAQDNESKIGLVRIDYNSGHQNPMAISEFVPEKFHPYVGKEFTNDEHHIHYHVQGYKSLAWAVPLADDTFEVKTLQAGSSFNATLAHVIQGFAKKLNIATTIDIQTLLL